MAHIDYYNAMRDMMETMKDSHKRLIKRVCMELSCPEKEDELISKFIDESIKLKKFKDSDAPKNPKTSYMFFCVEKRCELKKKQPDLKFTEIMQILSVEWGKLTEKQRLKYIEEAEKDKERFDVEKEDYEKKLYSSTLSEN